MIPMITRGEATKCCTMPGLSHLNSLLWMFFVPLPHSRECVIVLGSGAFLGRTAAPVNNQKPWGKPPVKSETKLSTNWATPQQHGLLLIARNSMNYQPTQKTQRRQGAFTRNHSKLLKSIFCAQKDIERQKGYT